VFIHDCNAVCNQCLKWAAESYQSYDDYVPRLGIRGCYGTSKHVEVRANHRHTSIYLHYQSYDDCVPRLGIWGCYGTSMTPARTSGTHTDLSSLYTQKKRINELKMEIAGPSWNITPSLWRHFDDVIKIKISISLDLLN